MTFRERFERRNAGLPAPCVETSERTPQTLSIHLSDGEVWVFPWSRFSHAHLRGEELKVVFADNEIVIRGQNLAGVAKEFAELGVEIIRTMAQQYRPLIPISEPFIVEIKVRKEG